MTVHDTAKQLPEIPVLLDHCRAMAMVEAILDPEGTERYHSFDSTWSETEETALMRDGSGDEYAVVFCPAGAYIRGFAHESPMSPYEADDADTVWPGVLDDVPEAFRPQVEEPAFSDEEGIPVVTACLWRESGDDRWRAGTIEFPESDEGVEPDEYVADPDGAASLFRLLADRSAESYREWAADYYDRPVDLAAVRHIFAMLPLTAEVVRALNSDLTLDDLAEDIQEIGYPAA
ncbi:hypothetical protein [Actinokineospora xionganensis]|uniref:Uncharacterized protein n=1 Tax=Actinokineospora xionganensis TaxID=2684470 RepID=A0ABR7KZ53_9PSEU|nr:hypothetical protein [Actinokineospora xionganensis]MBC6445724.1 hypothetical protein [Actinokineospora xionganensis]